MLNVLRCHQLSTASVQDSICSSLVYILQVSRTGCHLPSAPLTTLPAHFQIGPSTVSDPSFTSADSRTPSERQRGCLICPAPDNASAVDCTKEDMDDDEDGVVDSPFVLPNPISVSLDERMPMITLHPEALEGDTPFRNPVVDDRSDLALAELNGAERLAGARQTMSCGSSPRVQPSRSLAVTHRLLLRRGVKRFRGEGFVEGVVVRATKYTRSEDIPSFQRDSGRDITSHPRDAI